ncbi:unnamed protein product [Ceutorhynchus assimilis]|uniref:Uncharacterized protein n=1 Tax=Ceutorhynchus assimilis TaxID=467358 RepID=A0A9P0DQI8_9CUCU|nr:unnamed protein product [Ceutorhynchus assimilis]
MSFESFFDIKSLSDDMGLNINKNTDGDEFKINVVKILQFKKGEEEFCYKTSYKQKEWYRLNFRQRKRSKKDLINKNVIIKKAYCNPFQLSDNKKRDLLSLLNTNLIPAFYKPYFESILQ